jgi:hypothetical protein
LVHQFFQFVSRTSERGEGAASLELLGYGRITVMGELQLAEH